MASVIAQAQAFTANLGPTALARRITENLAAIRPLNAFIDERVVQPGPGGAGALLGVPIAIKANICVEGTLATAGSRILDGHRPSYTATAVERLVAAGATLVGSTNMDEFGMGSSTAFSSHGPTYNPYSRCYAAGGAAEWLTPGGSSGGSAVAVATGAVAAALGSDTGGSVRQPAAFCGVVGFKPSYGRIPRHGLIAYASSLDTVGIFARSVGDAALLYDVVAGAHAADDTCMRGGEEVDEEERGGGASVGGVAAGGAGPDYALRRLLLRCPPAKGGGDDRRAAARRAALASSDLTGLRVGCPEEFRALPSVAPDVLRAWDAAAAALRARGAEVVSVSLPSLLRAALPAYLVLASAEAASNLSRYDGVRFGGAEPAADSAESFREAVERCRSARLGPEVQRRILVGNLCLSRGARGVYYSAAEAARRRVVGDFSRAFAAGAGVDVLLAPVSPVPPWRSRAAAELDPALLYEADAMTVPASLAGLPAVAVPVALSTAGVGGFSEPVPLGMQLIGRPADDDTVLAVAAALEAGVAFPEPAWRLRGWAVND